MKKIYFCMILAVMIFMYIAIPASAATVSDIASDPNYEIYCEVENRIIDLDCIDDSLYYEFSSVYDPFLLYYEVSVDSYPGMISFGIASYYDFGGEDYIYLTNDTDDSIVTIFPGAVGFYMDFTCDSPLEKVVIKIATYKFRLSASAGGSADAYNDGYAAGYEDGHTDLLGEIDLAASKAATSTRLAITDKMQAWLAEFGCDVSHIVAFEYGDEIGAVYLQALSDHFDDTLPGMIDEWIDYGYQWGFREGQVDHIDKDFIVAQLDVLASNFSNTVFQVLNEKILGYSLMEFILALVIIMVVLVALPIIRGLL